MPAVDHLKAFGWAVRRARRDRELTQEQLGQLARMNPKTISEIERGNRNLTLLVVLRLAGALGMSASELFALYDVRRSGRSSG